MQKLDSYDPAKVSISTWVYTITRNTVTDYFRTRRRMVAFEEYMLDEGPAAEMMGMSCMALRSENDLYIKDHFSVCTE